MTFQPDALYNWQTVTTTPTPITVSNRGAYLCKAGTSPLIFKLPANVLMGFAFKIVGHSNLWQLQQNATQFCKLGIVQTTPGITGGINATTVSDEIWVVCVAANTEFKCSVPDGNPTLI